MEKITKHSANTRQQLIISGIEELNIYGFNDFSVRRIAKRCGVSCAAPYKHFKDKQNFIAEIISYINEIWHAKQEVIMAQYETCTTREQLLQMSLHYIRFLVENPYFRSIIMQNYSDFDEKYKSLRSRLSVRTYDLVSKYCEEVNMPKDVRHRKTFMIRSMIYGAALFFDNREMEYTEENMKMVADMMSREFDLP